MMKVSRSISDLAEDALYQNPPHKEEGEDG